MHRIPAMVAALAFLGGPALAGELVKLKAAEPAGVERVAEPVTSGVPFPEGLVKDVSKLALVDAAGKPVPAAFTAINLWPKDKSVRWALVDTQASAPAGGAAGFAVVEGTTAAPAARLAVDDGAESIAVDTGVLKFTVRKNGFRLFESVESLHAVMATSKRMYTTLAVSHPEGLAMTVKGVRYTSAADAESKVIVEEQNPMRVSILATGKLAPADGKGSDRYDYEVRIHAYAGSPAVKVSATVIKKYGKTKDISHSFEDLSLGLKLAQPGAEPTYAIGGDGAPATGKLAAGKTAGVLAKSSTAWEFTGEAKAAGPGGDPKAKKPLSLGWADLSGPAGGAAAGVYRFWQVWPKGLEVTGDGTMNIGLYPKACGAPQPFFTGMARTHEALLVFHGKDAKPEELQKKFAAFQKPLFLSATPEWYCRTGVFGSLAPVGAKLPGEAAAAFDQFDKMLSGYFDRLMTSELDKWQKRGVTMDAYGWLAYGDTLHYAWDEEPAGSPWKIAWDSNYYDLPHLACEYFARTGERKYWEYQVDHDWHLMDVDVIHWDPGFPQGGASRRCPATNHVGFDPPEHREPVVNVAFDHHKSESLFELYYLTGNRRALEVAMDLLGHAFRSKDADYGGTRKPGHQILTLVAGYWCTGDGKYLERARKIIDAGIARQGQNGGGLNAKDAFTDGICMEAFGKYYQATGDEAVLKAVQGYCDWLMARKARWTNCTFALALVYAKTGDGKYLEEALKSLGASKTNHISKDMGHMYRNAPLATGLVDTEKP